MLYKQIHQIDLSNVKYPVQYVDFMHILLFYNLDNIPFIDCIDIHL